jgi:hypothetical protein
MKRLLLGALGALLSVSFALPALANGRFPRAQRLIEHPNDSNKLVLTATYGLLQTSDRGSTWHHICESSFAFVSGEDLDAVVEVAADGAILASALRSLNRSAEPGCHFRSVLGGNELQSVPDLSLEKNDRNRGVAVLSTVGSAVGSVPENLLYETSDAGSNWTRLGVALPTDTLRVVHSVDVAPSAPNRIYVTGTDPQGRAQLLRSNDRGANYTAFEIPTDVSLGEFPYIGAVDPTNPDVLYVRTDKWAPNLDGVDEGADRLLYSSNGGETWQEAYSAAAKLLGFALSPDGSTLLIGYGDPVEGARFVEPEAVGLYKSATTSGSFDFEKILDGSVTCLTWTATGVYVCTSQQERQFELGFVQAPNFTLATPTPLTPLFRLTDVSGPLECPACTTGSTCGEDWQSVCSVFSACTDGGGATGGQPAGECPDGGIEPDGGGGASAGGADAAAGSAGTSTGGTGNAATNASGDDDSGCGCRTPGSDGDARGAAPLAGLVLAVWFAARRRARARAR